MELRDFPVYAVRRATSQTGHASVQSEELEYGQLDIGSGGEHEEDGQHCEQSGIQP